MGHFKVILKEKCHIITVLLFFVLNKFEHKILFFNLLQIQNFFIFSVLLVIVQIENPLRVLSDLPFVPFGPVSPFGPGIPFRPAHPFAPLHPL